MNDLDFEGQRPGEEIEKLIKTHPMRFLWSGIKVIVIWLIPVASYIFLGAGALTSILILIFLLWGLYIVIREWYEYSNDTFLITNQRIIAIDQHGFFNREISETNYDKIQEVSNKTNGFLGTTFNFGNVFLQTASSNSKIVLKSIPRPYLIQQEITKRIKTPNN